MPLMNFDTPLSPHPADIEFGSITPGAECHSSDKKGFDTTTSSSPEHHLDDVIQHCKANLFAARTDLSTLLTRKAGAPLQLQRLYTLKVRQSQVNLAEQALMFRYSVSTEDSTHWGNPNLSYRGSILHYYSKHSHNSTSTAGNASK